METYDVKVTGFKTQGRVYLLRLSFDEGVEFNFSAGQYVMVKYHDDAGDFNRSYSISSDPEHKTYIDLCIAIKDGGRGSHALAGVKEGDRLSVMGPLGKFGLEDHPDNDAIFVAGGTGIGPLRSMLKHLANTGFKGHITLFYSFRDESEYLYQEEFEKLATKDNFTLVPIATRPAGDWKGETKYVQEIFSRYVQGADNKDVYACGPLPMIEALFKQLLDAGFKEEQLHREVW